ncbi:unnamed protein product [Phytophthora fragariaefolia]|uniref:Unnamed protein product n=1 Tax=Phytophthora fragariaefolia TaxID=1490495 RepID=A0A9W7CIP2_9STRA|nr:unnamed protein product [Phytophthora fragariaefolia]
MRADMALVNQRGEKFAVCSASFLVRSMVSKRHGGNADLSMKFLEFHFANRENLGDKILLLWDDLSPHWTQEVKLYAKSLNVVLLKVPPRYTSVCQPADISWNKPFKGLLRRLWIDMLTKQLLDYKQGESTRKIKREQLVSEILRVRKTLDQQAVNRNVAELREKHKEKAFSLVGPSHPIMTDWITSSWGALSEETIHSGFASVGLLVDTREAAVDDSVQRI